MIGEFIFYFFIVGGIAVILYKFRDSITGWIKTKPRVFKDGILRDLDVLKRYGVEDATGKIVAREREWEEAATVLDRDLKAMKKEVEEKYKKGGST
jgi:hypothetical protein